METRALGKEIKSPSYFNKDSSTPDTQESLVIGSRDMAPQLPYIISGGTNTEHYYFLHISNVTDYKFHVKPEYFGNESKYTSAFQKRIKKILEKDLDATIFCVFDWDTIYNNKTNQEKHNSFVKDIKIELDAGRVILCPSMPCIEYWFLLHFQDYPNLIMKCGKELQDLLTPHMISYFPGTKLKLLRTLKKKLHVDNPDWVKNLCADNKLKDAIKRAKETIAQSEANGNLQQHSYSYIYKIFDK